MRGVWLKVPVSIAGIALVAMLVSGLMITSGKLSPTRTPLAKQSLWMLSVMGHHSAPHMLASLRLFHSDDPGEMQKGFRFLEQEAENGSCYSSGKLGWAYQKRLVVEKDLAKAVDLYEVAAKCGMTYWQILLAHAHQEGYLGLPKDSEKSTYWREIEPKTHVADHDCWVVHYYKDGTFPYDADKISFHENRCGG